MYKNWSSKCLHWITFWWGRNKIGNRLIYHSLLHTGGATFSGGVRFFLLSLSLFFFCLFFIGVIEGKKCGGGGKNPKLCKKMADFFRILFWRSGQVGRALGGGAKLNPMPPFVPQWPLSDSFTLPHTYFHLLFVALFSHVTWVALCMRPLIFTYYSVSTCCRGIYL